MAKVELQYMTTNQAAKLWGISQRRVGALCKQNRIEGVVIAGKTWLIPADTEKPKDERLKSEQSKFI